MNWDQSSSDDATSYSDDTTSTGESGIHYAPPPAARGRLPIAYRSQAPIGQRPPPMAYRSQAPIGQRPPPMAYRSQAPVGQRPPPMAYRSPPAPIEQPRPTNFGRHHWHPSPFMTPDLVPYQLTPVRALAPEYSETDTTNLAVPKLYAARIVQLKDELRLEDDGEAVKWLLKQSEPAIISFTGTGTMPIMRSSVAGHSNVRSGGGGGPLVMSAPLAGNVDFAHLHGESSTGG
ncbi:hypothetical protein L6452_24561 [Arctium lappa]|uniref:Uncharacterized protein n=1 Tax=Arctium lappa TaxID=4217 RepID=A0ACB9AAN0_ARCLA|nr:hypothetical protein L6452_24561 [Arctium lappa]